jgi:ABC-type oligopeptide transport system substrate-binding subunit
MQNLLFLLSFFLSSTVFAADPITFRVRLSEDLGTIDWNYGEVSPEIVYQLMEGLFQADQNGKPVPAAARSYRWNANKTELVIQLKPDRRWSDGSPLCAQQFVDSWARLQDKKFASPYAHFANNLKSFEAKTCRELRVKFERPAPEAPALLSHYVFLPTRTDQLQQNAKIFTTGKGLLVNGPYQVKEWKTNQSLVLERNPQYGGSPGKIEQIEFLFIPDENTAQILFEQKKVDWVRDIPPLMRTPTTERQKTFRVFPSLTTFYFGVNANKSEVLKDLSVRRALSETLDRKELAKVLGSEYRGTKTWVTKVMWSSIQEPKGTWDLLAVKKKLQAAEKDGKLGIVLRVYNKASHKLLAEWAQGQWEKKLGVRIPIEVQESKIYWKEIYTDPAPIFLSGVTAPYSHPRAFLQEFLTSSTANWTGWSSSDYDRAVNEEDFQKAETILHEGGFIIPLYMRDAVAMVQTKWQGFAINPLGQAFLVKVK